MLLKSEYIFYVAGINHLSKQIHGFLLFAVCLNRTYKERPVVETKGL